MSYTGYIARDRAKLFDLEVKDQPANKNNSFATRFISRLVAMRRTALKAPVHPDASDWNDAMFSEVGKN